VMKSAVAATSATAHAAAEAMRKANGSAVDAALAGFFADAGAREGALLAPMTAIAVGVGAGARILDGRARQPVLATERPRGTTADDEPPVAARVSAPLTPFGAILLHNARGRASLAEVISFGRDNALAIGERRRAALLDDLGAMKAAVCSSEPYVEALLAIGGRAAGGALSRADVVAAPPILDIDHRTVSHASASARVYEAEWSRGEPAARSSAPGMSSIVEIIAAVDAWGLAVVIAYEVFGAESLAAVPGLQIAVPLAAAPVQRGVPRVPPGTPIWMPAPIAIVDRGGGQIVAVGSDGRGAPGDAVASAFSAEQAARELGGRVACVALESRGARVLGVHAAP
jgi:hypothetical protein